VLDTVSGSVGVKLKVAVFEMYFTPSVVPVPSFEKIGVAVGRPSSSTT
jgi:hypothetical protein